MDEFYDNRTIGPKDLDEEHISDDVFDDPGLQALERKINLRNKSEGEPETAPAQEEPDDETVGDVEEIEADTTVEDAETGLEAEEPVEEQPVEEAPPEEELYAGKFKTVEAMEQSYEHLQSLLGKKAQEQPPESPVPEAQRELSDEERLKQFEDFANDPKAWARQQLQEAQREYIEQSYPTLVAQTIAQAKADNPEQAHLADDVAKLLNDLGALNWRDKEGRPIDPRKLVGLGQGAVMARQATEAFASAKKQGMEAGAVAERAKARAAVVGGTGAAPPPARQLTEEEIRALPPDEAIAYLEKLLPKE